jgi:hypothetical protein
MATTSPGGGGHDAASFIGGAVFIGGIIITLALSIFSMVASMVKHGRRPVLETAKTEAIANQIDNVNQRSNTGRRLAVAFLGFLIMLAIFFAVALIVIRILLAI